LSLTDPHDGLDSLMGKWLIKAYEPDHSNLLVFLRYRLSSYKPSLSGKWSANKNWFMSPPHKSTPDSRIWNQVAKSWKKLCRSICWIKPTSFEEVSSTRIWFDQDLSNSVDPAIPRERTTASFNHGLQKVIDTWNPKPPQMSHLGGSSRTLLFPLGR
jgi:hypothetical protein